MTVQSNKESTRKLPMESSRKLPKESSSKLPVESSSKLPMENSKKFPMGVQFFAALSVLSMAAFILVWVLKERGYYASGNDTWGHLFKADLMYQNIKEGTLYPLFTRLWYNGIQPFRYWAPLPYYLLAGLLWIAKGDIITTYYYFVGFSYLVGGIGWLLWGIKTKRMLLCTFLALLWFFLPDNMRVFFCEGNIPRMIAAVLIPYLVYTIWLFIRHEKRYAAFFITLLTAFLALTHLMMAAMVGIATFLFLVFYALGTRKLLRSVQVIISMLLGYVLVGIWLIPALSGGLVAMDSDASASVMRSLTYSLTSTLNPVTRVVGVTDTYYYGLSIVLICILGIIFANKSGKAGYYTNLIILLCTTPALIPLLSKLPLNQLLWMMRFTTIAYAYFLWSIIEWRNARRYFTLLLALLLLIDCVPSFMFSKYYFQSKGSIVDELQIAEDITNQRVALMDLSALSAYPSWELGEGDNPTQYTFGWAWQGASTASNIVMLNTALEQGSYEYLFDRCIELGNDTVIVLKELVTKAGKTQEELLQAAALSDYYLHTETNEAYIFHLDAPETFGVLTDYKGFAIGEYVNQIAFPYPTFIGASNNIEDYTIEQIAEYETLYLSGFEYDNLAKAEDMVLRLADRGVRVVIDMNHIPIVPENKRMYFLGVVAQDIAFSSMFPTLTFQGEELYLTGFPEEYETWNTKYIEGVTKIMGTADYNGQELIFAGTKDHDNIIFLGFNLLFYSMQTQDDSAYRMLNECFDVELYELPERTLVPISIEYLADKIIIDTPIPDINTTIAFQDNFVSEDHIQSQNNLLFVTQKHTEIELVYPYLKQGLLVSLIGVLGFLLWMIIIYVIDRKRRGVKDSLPSHKE